MRIGGLQKTTLLDYPGKVACTVFLPGCNLRCPFCHNAALVLPEQTLRGEISEGELFAFLEKRRGKLDGVCITGGEPTVYRDLPELIDRIRSLGFLVKLDTNGSHPDMLRSLLGSLDYVAMDIKNSPRRYAEACGGVDILSPVRESVSLLLEGKVDYEFRTTCCSPLHTPGEMEAIGEWIHGAKRYFLQSFVDSGNLVGQGMGPLTREEMIALQQAVLPQVPNTRIRGI